MIQASRRGHEKPKEKQWKVLGPDVMVDRHHILSRAWAVGKCPVATYSAMAHRGAYEAGMVSQSRRSVLAPFTSKDKGKRPGQCALNHGLAFRFRQKRQR